MWWFVTATCLYYIHIIYSIERCKFIDILRTGFDDCPFFNLKTDLNFGLSLRVKCTFLACIPVCKSRQPAPSALIGWLRSEGGAGATRTFLGVAIVTVILTFGSGAFKFICNIAVFVVYSVYLLQRHLECLSVWNQKSWILSYKPSVRPMLSYLPRSKGNW